jgi:Ca2+-transporting ATPase
VIVDEQDVVTTAGDDHRVRAGVQSTGISSAVLQVAGVLLAPLQALLGTESLTATELLACAAVAALPGLAVDLLPR